MAPTPGRDTSGRERRLGHQCAGPSKSTQLSLEEGPFGKAGRSLILTTGFSVRMTIQIETEKRAVTTTGTWQSLNQRGRYGSDEVVATAGNLNTKMLRVKTLQPNGASGAEMEIPAIQFQATAAGDYTAGWLDFLANLSLQTPLQYAHKDYYG